MSRKNRLFAKLASTVNGNGRLKSDGFASTVELGGGGVTAYATPSDLPLTGNEAGDQAFVSSTNRLYIFNGSGWFNIALVNTSPTITTGAEANYRLQKNGTPTVITLAATDPEETPIIWSYAVTSGAVGNTATINQVDNVITVTPSTDENDGGEFTLTFTASDGVNVDTSTSAFSLSFSWELDVTELTGIRYSRATVNGNFVPYGITLSSNGLHTYLTGTGNYSNKIYQYTSTSDSVLDHYYGYSIDVPYSSGGTRWDCYISNDGVYFYVYQYSDTWQRYTLSTPFDITTLDANTKVDGATLNYSNGEHLVQAFTLSDNGLKMYTLRNHNQLHQIIEYTLPSAFEIGNGTATRVAAYELPAAYGSQYKGIAIDPTGDNIYILHQPNMNNLHIIQYSLSTPYSIATASEVGRKTYTDQYPFSGNGRYAINMAINAGNIVIISNSSRDIFQYT